MCYIPDNMFFHALFLERSQVMLQEYRFSLRKVVADNSVDRVVVRMYHNFQDGKSNCREVPRLIEVISNRPSTIHSSLFLRILKYK